jgi:hypothetical protein
MRLLIPRNEGESHPIDPFDVFVSDVDVLLEFKPEGKVRLHAWTFLC